MVERKESLKILNKFAGEDLTATLPNVRTVFAGDSHDGKQRESRVFLLLGASNTKKSGLIDFMCNYFYGATLESEERFHIANEKFGNSTPPRSITTYVFNNAETTFRPIVIDTPGVGHNHECEKEIHDLFTSWLSHNDRHRIDVVGVVLSAQTRMTSAEEKELNKVLTYIPLHLRKNIVLLVGDSDGAPINIGILRRLNLHGHPEYKFNSECMFEKKHEDSLKEYLRENYWRMSEKNFAALFEQTERFEPKTISGQPHQEPRFTPIEGGRNLSDVTMSSVTTTTTTTKKVQNEETASSHYYSTIESLPPAPTRPAPPPPIPQVHQSPPPRIEERLPAPPPIPPPPPPPTLTPERPVPPPPPPPPPPQAAKAPYLPYADDAAETRSVSVSVSEDADTTITKTTTYTREVFGSVDMESREIVHSSVVSSEQASPSQHSPQSWGSAPPTPPKKAKEEAKEAFGLSPTKTPPPFAYGTTSLTDMLLREKQREEVHSSIHRSTSGSALHHSHHSSGELPHYLRSEGSESSSRGTVINTTNRDREGRAAEEEAIRRATATSSPLHRPANFHFPEAPPTGPPTYSKRVEELPHGRTVIEEKVVPTSHGYSSTVTKTTTLEFGAGTHVDSALHLMDRYSPLPGKYEQPPSEYSSRYANIGYGTLPNQRYSEQTILSADPQRSDDSSNNGGTLSPMNDGTVRYVFDERSRTHVPHVISNGSSSETATENDTGVYAYGTLPEIKGTRIGQGLMPVRETVIDDIPVAPPRPHHGTVEIIGGNDREVLVDDAFQRDSNSRLSQHHLKGVSQQRTSTTQSSTVTYANHEHRAALANDDRPPVDGTGERISQMYSQIQKPPPPQVPQHGTRVGSAIHEAAYGSVSMRETSGRTVRRAPERVVNSGVEQEMATREEMLRRTAQDVQRDSYLERMAPSVPRPVPMPRNGSHPPTPDRNQQQHWTGSQQQISSQHQQQTTVTSTTRTDQHGRNTVMIPEQIRDSGSPVTYRIGLGQKQTTTTTDQVQRWGPEIPAYHERYPDPTQRPGYEPPPRHLAEEEETDDWSDEGQDRHGRVITDTTVTQTRVEHQGHRPSPIQPPPPNVQYDNDPRSPSDRVYPSTPKHDPLRNPLLEGQHDDPNTRRRKEMEKRIRNRTSYFGPEYPHWKMKFFLTESTASVLPMLRGSGSGGRCGGAEQRAVPARLDVAEPELHPVLPVPRHRAPLPNRRHPDVDHLRRHTYTLGVLYAGVQEIASSSYYSTHEPPCDLSHFASSYRSPALGYRNAEPGNFPSEQRYRNAMLSDCNSEPCYRNPTPRYSNQEPTYCTQFLTNLPATTIPSDPIPPKTPLTSTPILSCSPSSNSQILPNLANYFPPSPHPYSAVRKIRISAKTFYLETSI